MWATSSGTLRLNWQRQRIGRITRVSGETTKRGLAAAHSLLDDLYRHEHVEVLESLRDGLLDMGWLMRLHRDGLLDVRRPSLGTLLLRFRPLADVVEQHLFAMGRTASSRKRYGFWLRRVQALLPADATLGETLDHDWASQSLTWQASAATWNGMRDALSRLLTLATGSSHDPLRLTLMRRMPRRKVTREWSTLQLDDVVLVAAQLPPAYGVMIRALVATGMRVGELFSCRRDHFDRRTGRLSIPTVTDTDQTLRRVHPDARTKTGGRVIYVGAPLCGVVEAALDAVAATNYNRLRYHWNRACEAAFGRRFRLHALRHLHAQLAVAGNVPITIVRRQLGHASLDQTLGYADAGPAPHAAEAVARAMVAAENASPAGDTPDAAH